MSHDKVSPARQMLLLAALQQTKEDVHHSSADHHVETEAEREFVAQYANCSVVEIAAASERLLGTCHPHLAGGPGA